MSDANNPISLDENTVFFDSNNIYYVHRSNNNTAKKEFRNTWFYNSENIQMQKKYNYFDLNTFNINLFVGLESNYCMNNIINSSFYSKDLNLENQKITAFRENDVYKGNDIEISFSPMKVSKTYGQENPDELFQKISEEPFEDIDNIENVSSFFEMPSELKYPRYFNHYSLSRLNSNISVFGTIEEVDGSILTERSLKGIKCDLIQNGTDARQRAVNFSNSISLMELEISS